MILSFCTFILDNAHSRRTDLAGGSPAMEEGEPASPYIECWVSGGNKGIKRRQDNIRAESRKIKLIESRKMNYVTEA